MAGDLNRASLIGRLGADPEVKTLTNGGRVVNFSLATSEEWRDRSSGERRERTEWHRVVIWNEGLGKIAEQYLRKGHKCLVEGKIQTRKWTDQSGSDRYSTEIVLNGFDAKLLLLGAPGGGGGGGGSNGGSTHYSGGSSQYSGGGGRAGDIDDDIPF